MFKSLNKHSKKVLFHLSILGILLVTGGVFLTSNPGQLPLAVENRKDYSPQQKTVINAQYLANHWVVNSAQAKQLILEGATVLDARGNNWLIRERLDGSMVVNWQDFSELDKTQKGIVLENKAVLTQKLRAIGIFNDLAVVVFADPMNGWGEDGRMVWMLRTLGHKKAVLVDGGYQALIKVGIPLEQAVTQAPKLGDFTVNYNNNWQLNREQLKQSLNNKQKIILDVRESREFQGQTPYGEQRAGHIPGAIHLYYRELLDKQGYILPPQKIINKLQALGVTANVEIAVYCTAGVRAGWVTTVLTDLGFPVKNYPGSMLDWSSASDRDYPLSKEN
jgi:thiosulfate/3-mercaptopyruvate sulfurtransferase